MKRVRIATYVRNGDVLLQYGYRISLRRLRPLLVVVVVALVSHALALSVWVSIFLCHVQCVWLQLFALRKSGILMEFVTKTI